MSEDHVHLAIKTAFVLGTAYLAYRVVVSPRGLEAPALKAPPRGTRPKFVPSAPLKRLPAAV